VGIWVGIDIAKGVHWATAIDDLGQVVLDQRVANEPAALQQVFEVLGGLGGVPVIGLDVVGGIAGLAEAMLWAAGFRLVDVSGLAVNRARQGTTGGEHKSDPRDARVIAEQVRTRRDLRPSSPSASWSWSCGCWWAAAVTCRSSRPAVWPACTTCWLASTRGWNGCWT
jgi:transposase